MPYWGDETRCLDGYNVFLTDRGGMHRVGEITKLAQVQWGRVRDDPSQATISISGANCAGQADLLTQIMPRRHELVIYRNGERVWEGPVSRTSDYTDHFEVAADDIMAYINSRPLTKAWNNAGVNAIEVTTRLWNILSYELANPYTYTDNKGNGISVPGWEQVDPPANVLPFITVHHSLNEARTSASTTPFQMTVGEHIDNLGMTGGIDYTVVGRALHIWDTSRPLGRTPVLTESSFFGDIVTSQYGSDFAALAFTVAQDGSYGGAGQNSDYYGPWAKIFTTYDENATAASTPSQAELNSQAARNLVGRNPVPLEVRVPDNSTLRLSPAIGINDLVPGVRIPLRATLNFSKVAQLQKLDTVTVTANADGENVQITLSPASKPDSDEA